MTPTVAKMTKRMMGTDLDWAPTFMKRSDIDLTITEDDPRPCPPREPIVHEREQFEPAVVAELTHCLKCKLKTYDERCRNPYCD